VDGKIRLLTLDRNIEETIAAGIIQTDHGQQLSIEPDFVRELIAQLNEKAKELINYSDQAVVLCSPIIRPHLKTLIERFIPNIVVLSHNEITSNIDVESFGTVRVAYAS